MSRLPLQQTTSLLEQSRAVLITTRTDAPVGSLASMFALGLILERAGKTVTIVTESKPPRHLQLPGSSRCLTSLPREGTVITVDTSEIPVTNIRTDAQSGVLRLLLETPRTLPREAIHIQSGPSHFDVIIVVDAPDLISLGAVFSDHTALWYSTPVVVCDRSPQNEQFGQINMIDLNAASTIEIIDRIGQALNVPLTPDIQHLYLTAIIADTDRFMEPHTSPRAFSLAATIVDAGIDHIAIMRDLYKTRDLPYLQLLGRSLTRVQTIPTKNIAWTMITDGDLLETQASPESIPLMIHEIAHLSPASDIVVLLHRTQDGTRVTIETATPTVHARDLASLLGPPTGGVSTAVVFTTLTDPREILEILGRGRTVVAAPPLSL